MLAGMGISRDTRAQLLSHGTCGVQAARYPTEKGDKSAANVRPLRRKNKNAA